MDSEGNTRRESDMEPAGGDGGGRRRRRRWPWVLGGLVALGLIGLAVVSVVLLVVLGSTGGVAGGAAPVVYEEEYVSGEGSNKVAVIPVQGAIASADSSLGGAQPTVTPEGLADALAQAADDTGVRAVVLEVNSPGGGVTASDEMHQSIVDFKKNTEKPVVVSMGDTAASGGYYISTAADEIVANETTLTGSLGVIFQLNNFEELADKYGYKQVVIKSGEFKDIGNAFRQITPEEREIFQSLVDESYAEFVDVISSGRGIPEDRVREIADGRIYSGQRAKELGLVDSFGGLDEASAEARELANAGQATVVRYIQAPTFTDTLLSGLSPQPTEAERLVEESGLTLEPKPYYLYLPGA
ncbi:MAG: signal peptide peptidase SppA [Rubrobacter sp.]|nr:signal peptide peptidase SppA [Rubrobacter sp.]MDQ3361665.1 signal peptide peptidase SppA [Actinomycetota bacterium]